MEEVQSTWQEYSDLGQACRGGVRRVKTQWSFKPAKDMKGNKNDFYKYINSKSMANVASTLSGAVDPTIKHTEKSVAFSDLVFTGTVCSLASQVLVPAGWVWESIIYVQQNWVLDHLEQLNIARTVTPDSIHPRGFMVEMEPESSGHVQEKNKKQQTQLTALEILIRY